METNTNILGGENPQGSTAEQDLRYESETLGREH